MAQVSISEAARLAGVSRSTLNRHLQNGAISKHRDASGRPYIETSELLRFYGELSQPDRTDQDIVGQHGTGQLKPVVSDLERKLYEAQAALDLETVRREAEEAAREKAEAGEAHWRAQAERLTLLLTDQRKGLGGDRRPWWERLFGGGSERHEPGEL